MMKCDLDIDEELEKRKRSFGKVKVNCEGKFGFCRCR